MRTSRGCVGRTLKTPQGPKSWIFGRQVYYSREKKEWLYLDGTSTETCTRPCPRCKLPCKAGEPDPCLGYLPGVLYACCGHGVHRGYVLFENGVKLEFRNSKVPFHFNEESLEETKAFKQNGQSR